MISSLLKDHTSGSKLTQLKIAQRLRLDQPKLDEVTRRIKQGSPNGYAVLLATQATPSGPGSEGMPTVEPGLQRASQEPGLLLETEAGCRGDQPASGWIQGQRQHRHALRLPAL